MSCWGKRNYWVRSVGGDEMYGYLNNGELGMVKCNPADTPYLFRRIVDARKVVDNVGGRILFWQGLDNQFPPGAYPTANKRNCKKK